MIVHPSLFGYGDFELPRPDGRPTRRRPHDVLVDRRPSKGDGRR